MSDRLTLALPVDVARAFDATVTQTQLNNDTMLGSAGDVEVLSSFIEDAEDEFRSLTDAATRLSRAGTPGDRTTYDQVTYKVPGHADFRRSWTGVGGMYDLEEVEKNLQNGRLLPFDSAEGDEAYLYRGLGGGSSGDEWEDVTDDYGDSWAILNHREGTVVFDPVELMRSMRGSRQGVGMTRDRLSRLRFAISYRYGTQGGDRGHAGATDLDASLSQGATTTVAVDDASRLPTSGGGSVVLLVGREYIRATVDASSDEIDVLERGVRGTTDAAHSSGDRLQYTPGAVRKAVTARAGMSLVSGGRYMRFLPDNEDDLDEGDLLDEFRETWTTTVEAMK